MITATLFRAARRGFAAVVCVCALAAFSGECRGGEIASIADLNGKRIGVIIGTVLDTAANEKLDFTQIHYFDNTENLIEALYLDEIDVFLDDEPVARFLAARDAGLRVVDGKLLDDEYGFAMRLDDDELYRKVDPLVKKMIADGTVRRLGARWLDSSEGEKEGVSAQAGGGAALRFGVSPVSAPFVYRVDGNTIGFDIEFMGLIAERLGMRLEVVEMDFSKLIPSLQSGDVDVIGSCLSITEERKEQVRFTDSYHKGGAVAITLK